MSTKALPSCVLVVLAIASTSEGMTQPWWGPAELPGSGGWLNAVYASNDGQYIYYGGVRDVDPNTSGIQSALLRYSASGWDTIPIDGEVRTITEYHDTLYVGGSFGPSYGGPDSLPAYNVQYWNEGTWHKVGEFDSWEVRSLRVLDDTLYAVGSFVEVDGQPCTGMIRLINDQWQPLPFLSEPDPNNTAITDIIKHQGRLIAVGTIFIGDGNGIAYLDGDQWHILGPGLEAGFSSVRKMIIYHGDLIVGGQISITPNNPGRDIMRWDGMQFHRLGVVGLQSTLGDDSGFSTVSALSIHDDKLFVGGGFHYAGGNPSRGMATWDGTEWCSLPGNLSEGPGHSGVWGSAFYQDTLFVICGTMADGDTVKKAAKFIGESYAGPCESEVGVGETASDPVVHVSPNPATERVRLQLPADLRAPITVHNAAGALVLRTTGPVRELDVRGWPRGLYLVRCGDLPAQRLVLE